MLPPKKVRSSRQRELVKVFETLSLSDQDSVLAFAEFLSSRQNEQVDEPTEPAGLAEPKVIARPESESVVAAIKRLSQSFYMLEKDELLHKASSLMGAHVLQGRPAKEVIDELELLFQQAYEKAKLEESTCK